jgi:uncharacterized membrane-anchored protein
VESQAKHYNGLAAGCFLLFLSENKPPMKKTIAFLVLLVACVSISQAQDSVQFSLDSIESSFMYQTGEISLDNGIGKIQVPKGFRYLDSKQAGFVIQDLWGNPDGSGTLGMLVPENIGLLADDSWAFIITYDEMGYVKDDDADEIDYDELMEEMQSDIAAENEERSKAGFEKLSLIGWASKPFYDTDKKVLHWAKEIKFGENEFNTLNYNVRVLGRKGVVVLNAVASMNELPQVKESIAPVLSSFNFADGHAYSDFDPEIDEVAAWTIGGLVAGKMLAKVGILAFLLKYIKLIGIGIAALGTGLWKWYKRRTELPEVRNIEETTKS